MKCNECKGASSKLKQSDTCRKTRNAFLFVRKFLILLILLNRNHSNLLQHCNNVKVVTVFKINNLKAKLHNSILTDFCRSQSIFLKLAE